MAKAGDPVLIDALSGNASILLRIDRERVTVAVKDGPAKIGPRQDKIGWE